MYRRVQKDRGKEIGFSLKSVNPWNTIDRYKVVFTYRKIKNTRGGQTFYDYYGDYASEPYAKDVRLLMDMLRGLLKEKRFKRYRFWVRLTEWPSTETILHRPDRLPLKPKSKRKWNLDLDVYLLKRTSTSFQKRAFSDSIYLKSAYQVFKSVSEYLEDYTSS